jgi:hypothetical protein
MWTAVVYLVENLGPTKHNGSGEGKTKKELGHSSLGQHIFLLRQTMQKATLRLMGVDKDGNHFKNRSGR